jgi:hypothetical protein
MAETEVERRNVLEWTIPLFETVPLAPLWIWLFITVGWFSFYLTVAYTQGWIEGTSIVSLSFWQKRAGSSEAWGWFQLHFAALVGYFPAAIVWAQRGVVQNLHDLRPVLRCSEAEFQDLLRRVTCINPRTLVVCSVVGVAWGWPAVVFFSLPESFGHGWDVLRIAVLASLATCATYLLVTIGRRLAHVGEVWTRIDLLDLRSLRPFAQRGLRTVVILVGFAMLLSLIFVGVPGDRPTVASLILLPVVAAVALLVPTQGVRRRIQREKQSELERVQAEIRANLGDSKIQGGRMADLIAYRGLLESINPWLFDRSIFLRFILILGAGMSMIAGALVERLVDAVLG